MYEGLAEHIFSWLSDKWAPPFRMTLLPTDLCNLKCQSCWRWSISPPGEISWVSEELSGRKFLNIIEEAANLGVKECELSGGGEPLLRKELVILMMKKIKDLGMRGDMTTNGTLFTPDLLNFLIDIEWDHVIISLDGPNAEINDFLRPPKGTFDKIIQNLELLRDLKVFRNRNKPTVDIQCVLSKKNINHIVPMLRLAAKYNVKALNFELIKRFAYKCDGLMLNPQDFKIIDEQLEESKEIIDEYSLFTNIFSFSSYPQLIQKVGKMDHFLKSYSKNREGSIDDPLLLSSVCYEPWYRIYISSIGETAPCCLATYSKKDNIKWISLKEIWLGESFSNFRNNIIKRDFPHPCKQCHATLFTHSRWIGEELRTLWVKKNVVDNEQVIKSSFQILKKAGQIDISLISREYPPETGWGGIGTYTYHLAHGLANLGHKVHVIAQSLDYDKEYLDGNVFVHRISHPSLLPYKSSLKEFALRLEYSYKVYQKLKELIDKYKIDIVEAPNFSAEGFVYSFFKKTPLVTRLHTHFSEVIEFSQWPKTLDRRLSCWLENAAILKSDLVTCSTKRHKDLVFKEIGQNSNNISIIPLGVPLPDLKEEGPEEGKPLTVLFVGRLEKRKGVHVLFKAIPIILEEFPETKFLIIGRDTFVTDDFISFDGEESYSFKARLIKSIPEKYLKNISFLDHVDYKMLAEFYTDCDIFVAPSLYESFGFIYIEAMSHAKPVIGCGVGGVPEVIKDGLSGILVPPSDHFALAEKIISLIKEKSLRIHLGREARKYVEKNFNINLMVERSVSAYKKVLNK